jgi:hypothetical protein
VTRQRDQASVVGVIDAHATASAAYPVRASVLAVASRIMLAVLAVVVVASITVAVTGGAEISTRGTVPPSGVPLEVTMLEGTIDAAVATDPSGTSVTHAVLLAAILIDVPSVGGTLTELRVGRPEHSVAPVGLVVELPQGTASEVGRLLTVLGDAGVGAPRVRALIPSPFGTRVELEGVVRLADDRLGSDGTQGFGAGAVGLTDLVGQSGVVLLRLETPTEAAPVRMSVRGDVPATTALLAGLEQTHTAPLRFEELRIERTGEDLFETHVRFRLREAAPRSRSSVVRP